ncbi:MAG: hypothetical protein ABR571_00060 [Jatrophihabitans sp.]|uniref:hypothetical protein n=1 Tax=Jatrophihabitans sp. TaxID=1932789 RepID=UPI003911E08A
MLRRVIITLTAAGAALLLSAGPALAQDCFLTHASANSHMGKSAQWSATPLAAILAAPPSDGEDGGFGMCAAQVSATLSQVKAAGLPTVLFVRTTKVLPDAGGPGKGGIDHFDSSPIIGQITTIALGVLGDTSITC